MGENKTYHISPYCYPGLKLSEHEKVQISKFPKIKICKNLVLQIVAEECQVTVSELLEKTRKREVVDGRHIFCAIARNHLKITLSSIGQIIGHRDHTTVSHAIKKFEERMMNEEFYKNKVIRIYEKLGIL